MSISTEQAAAFIVIAYNLGVKHARTGKVITAETHPNPGLSINAAVMLADAAHEKYKIIRVDQGWKTGIAECECGKQFAVDFEMRRTRRGQTEHVYMKPGQLCPDAG